MHGTVIKWYLPNVILTGQKKKKSRNKKSGSWWKYVGNEAVINSLRYTWITPRKSRIREIGNSTKLHPYKSNWNNNNTGYPTVIIIMDIPNVYIFFLYYYKKNYLLIYQ